MNLQVGKPVTGDELIGREKEIRTIKDLLKAGQSVVLIAPRRFGKTSVLFEVMQELKKEHWFTCYVDLFSVPTLFSLAERITEGVLSNTRLSRLFRKFKDNVVELARQLQIKQEFEGTEFVLGFAQKDPESWQLLEQSIDFIDSYSGKKNARVLAAFDEFGDIKKLDGDRITKLFRSKMQVQKHTAYMFTGSYETVMNNIFIKENAPFYRFARIIRLGYIDFQPFFKYLTHKLEKEGVPYKEATLKRILKTTRGHPYYTQLFLQEYMLIYKVSEKNTLPSFHKIMEHVLLSEQNYLEQFWQSLSSSKEERIIVMKLAEKNASLYSSINRKDINVARGIKSLTGKGVIIKQNEKYLLADPLLEIWIQKYVLR